MMNQTSTQIYQYVQRFWKNSIDWLIILPFAKKNAAENFKIHDKNQAVVTDNAANMNAGVRQTKFPLLPCFTHTFNLIVQNAVLKSISDTVEKIKTIVRFKKIAPQPIN